MNEDIDLMATYQWLRDALKPHCDKVIGRVANFGQTVGIGCIWGEGPTLRRKAMWVEHPERGEPDKHYSLNQEISEGRTTRENVIAEFIAVRV